MGKKSIDFEMGEKEREAQKASDMIFG